MAADRPTKGRRVIPARPKAPDPLSALLSLGARRDDELERLNQQVRENERIWAGFRRIELRMIGAHSLEDLLRTLVYDLPLTFHSVEHVTLACVDPEIVRLLREDALDRMDGSPVAPEVDECFIDLAPGLLEQLYGAECRPRLGPCDSKLKSLLFPNYRGPLGSVALAPLSLRGRLIGSLNQASRSATHFTPHKATDLLEHLAAVAAMCLDNAVSHARLKRYGLTDPLTSIGNRRFAERRLAEEVERWSRREEPLVCMLADIDHFKQVNDQHGHAAGDRVLQEVAELLGRDLRGADVLARYGGEEFMLLLPNATAAQGLAIAKRLCARVEGHRFTDASGEPLAITLSIGVSCLCERSASNGVTANALVEQADTALYRAKQGGRNRAVLFEPEPAG